MASYKDEVKKAILKVVDDQHYILGENVTKFEAEFAGYMHHKYCVGVGNGTDAIRIALLALGVKPGDEVISPAFNVAYTALAVEAIGAKNVFVDCWPNDTNMMLSAVEEAITVRTRAIIAVHLYGHMEDMEGLSALAKAYGLLLIEDAAQAHGASTTDMVHGSTRPGYYSDAVAYSFYPTKNLGALGEAGAIITNLDVVADRARLLRDGGRTDRYLHVLPGINSGLDEIQAAVLRVKLPYLERNNIKRTVAATYYAEGLRGVGDVKFPSVNHRDVYHLYVIRTKRREALREHLLSRGVPSLVHYPVPVPYQPCFLTATMGGPWPNAEEQARRVLSLPMHADITVAEQDMVIAAVKEFYSVIQDTA